jgi:uncharacterized protein involved in exopolysaccharide biosynthesis
MKPLDSAPIAERATPDSPVPDLAFYANALLRSAPMVAAKSVAAAALVLGITYLIPPTFTGRTSFILAQSSQSPAAAALASLGSLSNLAGATAGVRTTGDQFVALLHSVTVQERIVDKFKLVELYGKQNRTQARIALSNNSRFTLGKREGLIIVEVDDKDPQRAADLANQFIVELITLSGRLTLTEAQQRRSFYEARLRETSDRLRSAQLALQGSGFDDQSLRAEPKATAEGFARLAAEASAAEVRLSALRQSLTESAPEIKAQAAIVASLQARLAKLSTPADKVSDQNYVAKYREFKYQETLFEMFSKQYELARLDEARESSPIQVIDVASAPEMKSKPKRLMITVLAGAIACAIFAGLALARAQRLRH